MAKKPVAAAPTPAEIRSKEGADIALSELLQMATIEAAAKSICDEACNAAIKTFNAACKIKVGETEMNFADRRKQLEDGLFAFATANKKELFNDPRTLRLNHGEIGFREGNKCVMPIEDDEKDIKTRLVEKIVAGVTRAVKKLSCGACNVLSVSFSINKTGLLDAFRVAAFKLSALKKFGLTIAVTERFFVEPKEQEVTSQPGGQP